MSFLNLNVFFKIFYVDSINEYDLGGALADSNISENSKKPLSLTHMLKKRI